MDFYGKQSWHSGSGRWGGRGEGGFERQGKPGGYGAHWKNGGFNRYGENGGYGGSGEGGDFNGRGEGGGFGGRGGHGGRGGGGFSIGSLLDGKPNAQILFVGAVSCTRHRGFQMGDLMREGKMAILSPTASDFATGRYLHQIVEAAAEICQERGSKEVVLMYGCQCAVLSTDFDLLAKELKDHYDITLTVHDHCHMCRTEDEGWHNFGEKGGM